MAMNAAFQVMLHIKKHLIFLPVSFFIKKNVYICKDVIKFYFFNSILPLGRYKTHSPQLISICTSFEPVIEPARSSVHFFGKHSV